MDKNSYFLVLTMGLIFIYNNILRLVILQRNRHIKAITLGLEAQQAKI